MALCLAPALDRQRLVHLALASSLASIGATNDENTEWGEKVEEVTRELFAMLPAGRAGRLDGSREHTAYRGVLELEEVMLRWEEEVKDGTTKATEVEVLLAKMARVGFPGESHAHQGHRGGGAPGQDGARGIPRGRGVQTA